MIESLLGLPFTNKGRDPETGFDCWGLVIHLYRERHDIELPDFVYNEASNRTNSLYFIEQTSGSFWKKVDPKEGAVVVFKIGGIVRHAGYMINDHMFIHVLQGTSVVIEDVRSELWAKRVAGYYEKVE